MKGLNDNNGPEEWLWSQAKGQKLSLLLGVTAMMTSSYANQAVPRLMGRLIDPKVDTKNGGNSILSSVLIVGAVGGLASFTRTVTLNAAKERIAANLRKELFSSLLMHRDLNWFQAANRSGSNHEPHVAKEDHNEGTETKLVTDPLIGESGLTPAAVAVVLRDDVETASHVVTTTLANILRSSSSCIFGTYHMLSLNPELMGLAILVAPIVGTVGFLTRKYLKKVQSSQQEAALHAAAFVEDKLNHIMMVKLSNREEDEVEKYAQIQDEYVQHGLKSALADGLSMGAMFTLSTASLCGVLLAGGKAVKSKRMTHGDLLSFSTYSFMLALGSAGLARAAGEYVKGMRCAARLFALAHPLSQSDGSKNDVQPKNLNVQLAQSISTKGVSFDFGKEKRVVLDGISIVLKRGKVVALTGQNGSGKSTLAALLAGLYSPTVGSVVVEAQSTKDSSTTRKHYDFFGDVDRSTQAALVQVVPQQPALFNTSIIENIRYSSPNAPNEQLSAALKATNCESFISLLDGAMEYEVGRNGSKLSGGQRQRLGIARALVADTPFLILDEPVSALDSEGESAINDAVKACREQNRGLLIISHKPNTLELADEVVVMKDGRIVQQGVLSDLKKERNGELVTLMPQLVGSN